MLLETFALALSNLKHRGIRSWLTLLGIIIGIAAVIALLSLGQGLQNAITGQFSGISADRLVLTNTETGFGPPGSTAVKKLNEHDRNLVEQVPNVISTIPRLIRITAVEYNREKHFIFTGSLPKEQESLDFIYTAFQIKTEEGKLLKASDRNVVLLGSEIGKDRHFGKEIHVGSRITIQGKEFEVAGILSRLGNLQFNNAIFMPEDDLKDILNIDDEINLLVIRIGDISRADQTVEDLTRKLRKDRGEKAGEEDFSIQTPAAVLSSVNTILTAINIVVAGIAAIALLIGSIGVSNTMFTSILERKKEIGTMKAVGAKNADILMLFLIESGLLGLVGGLIGVALGYAIAKSIEWIAIQQLNTTLLQAASPSYLILGCLLFAFLIGAVSGLFPAWRASKLKTVDALRYE